MTRRWPMKAGAGRLLVRASATILCVRKGMSLTKPALTLVKAGVDTQVLVATRDATRVSPSRAPSRRTATHCSALQHSATRCDPLHTPKHIAAHCYILLHVAAQAQWSPNHKLRQGGFSIRVHLFCLICTINPNKTGILDEHQKMAQVVPARWLVVAGLDTRRVPTGFDKECATRSVEVLAARSCPRHLLCTCCNILAHTATY